MADRKQAIERMTLGDQSREEWTAQLPLWKEEAQLTLIEHAAMGSESMSPLETVRWAQRALRVMRLLEDEEARARAREGA